MNFKKEAQKHQLNYFVKVSTGKPKEHWLDEEEATSGKIFYPFDYDILKFVQERRKKQNTPQWFYDTLRSQHIPFNFFIPLIKEKELASLVLGNLLKIQINKIEEIIIEHPSQYQNPLKDKTSFDVFVSYVNKNGEKGLLGIEIKYTEGGYSPTKTERLLINDNHSIYYKTTERSNLYKEESIIRLKENSYRQIWRNHLLAYAYADSNKFIEYKSVTLYHEGNTHFCNVFEEYNAFLTDKGKDTLHQITFSDFCNQLEENAKIEKQRKWILYLKNRYNII